MSHDPTLNDNSLRLKGDINPGKGQFGLVTQTVDTSVGLITQTIGTFYSDYYQHYIISTSVDGDFRLASIGSEVSIGYTCCIQCPANVLLTGDLTVRAADNSIVAVMHQGDKVFLTAAASTSTWRVAFAVPEGRDNWLLVYTGKYPEVRLLPIQKEFYYDTNFQYGIKSIASFDSTEPANLINNLGDPTGLTNLNRVVFEGSTNIRTNLLSLGADALQSCLSCDSFFYTPDGSSISSSIACHDNASFEQLGDSVGVWMIGCSTCNIDNSLGTLPMVDCGVASSINSGFRGVPNGTISQSASIATLNCDITTLPGNTCQTVFMNSSNDCDMTSSVASSISSSLQSSITSSNQCSVNSSINGSSTNSRLSTVVDCDTSMINNNILSSVIASDNVTLQGDGVFTFNANPAIGYDNTHAGITVLSSHGLSSITSVNDIRYCVVGGYNGVTWSIDSKTGIHYGSSFNSTQPLPGLAEMYENAVVGEIPYGRLLQVVDGRVRLANNGEVGFMISRPYETAAFVCGNTSDWPNKYVTDNFGLPILDVDGNKQLNPNYDPNQVYLPRSSRRDQWTTCERTGLVVVEYVDRLSIGDYLVSSDEGIAKRSNRVTNIRVIEVIDDKFVKVDLSNQSEYNYLDFVATSSTLPKYNVSNMSTSGSNVVFSRDTFFSMTMSFVFDRVADINVYLDGPIVYYYDVSSVKNNGQIKYVCQFEGEVVAGDYKLTVVGYDDVASFTIRV